jgi:hypothetical protein
VHARPNWHLLQEKIDCYLSQPLPSPPCAMHVVRAPSSIADKVINVFAWLLLNAYQGCAIQFQSEQC